MSLLSQAQHDLEHLLAPILHGKTGASVAKTVLADAAKFYIEAQPIVETIELDLKAVAPSDQTGLIAAIGKFLNKYELDAGTLQILITQYAALPASDRWHDLAVFALGKIVPAGTDLAMLNLAVELAYNVLKHSLAAKASVPKPAA